MKTGRIANISIVKRVKIHTLGRVLLCLIAAGLFLTSQGILTPVYGANGAGTTSVSLDLREVDLPVFVKFVSDLTGKSFVFDERVRGKVTIVSPREIDVGELYDVFLSILDFKGFTAIPDGNVIKIVPSKEAKQRSGNLFDQTGLMEKEGFVTRLLPLKFTTASEAVKVISPLMSPNGAVNFNSETNTLVITDSPFNMGRLERLVRELDKKPEVGRLKIFVYYLENARAEEMAKSLNDLIARPGFQNPKAVKTGKNRVAIRGSISGPVSISFEKNTNTLIIRALEEDYEVIKDVVEKLDIRRRQVFVEAAIAEISLTKLRELGLEFNFMNSFQSHTLKGVGGTNFGNISTAATGPEGLSQLTGLAVGLVRGTTEFTAGGATAKFLNIGALLRAIESESGINILSTPQLLTTDNQEAEIVVGENVPLVTNKTVTSGGNIQTSIERQDVGVRLKITPHIAEGDFVRLDIYQEISSVEENAAFDPNLVGPLLSKRFARTSVVVKSGETVVIAGLISDDTREIVQKVPILGDIPILGYLFRVKKKQKDKKNLFVFITPRIIKDYSLLTEITEEKEREMKKRGKLK